MLQYMVDRSVACEWRQDQGWIGNRNGNMVKFCIYPEYTMADWKLGWKPGQITHLQ